MLIRKIIPFVYFLVSAVVLSAAAEAKSTKSDQAPPPPAVPVPKVDQSTLTPLAPQSLEGPAKAVTGDRISLGDYQVRLYGIAAPDMGSEHGPASRLALDSLLAGQRVKCTIFGKTPASDLLGQCSAGDTDLAKQLVARGFAAVYRDSTAGTDPASLDADYDAAETQARQGNLGIWSKPAAATPHPDSPAPILNRAALAYILGLIAVLTIPITMVSIWRSNSHQRERWRQARRYAMATGLAAEAEIMRAAARQIQARIADLPKDKPVPITTSSMLTLPSATFWSTNAERLELLPVEVTVPLLRLYALHEEASRMVTLAPTIPQGALTSALNAVEAAADRSIDTIERAMGIKREKPAEPPAEAAAAEKPAAPAPAAAAPSAQTADSATLPR
ncbi:MAG TPA: thermonuclease family protein [Dongiaceae bacterium]|nr:thermonuclease family protein [Dongiaceae bacterium]